MNSFEEKNDTKDKSNDFEKSPEENKEIEDLCEKLIVKNTCLASNVRTVHKSEKIYTCDTCGKDFGKFGNLKRHVTNVHEGLKSINVIYAVHLLAKHNISKVTLSVFMKERKILNVRHVVKLLAEKDPSKYIYQLFIKV